MKRVGRNILIQRCAGLVLMLLVLVLLDPLQGDIIHRLVLPITALIAGAMILRSTMAVALATGTLAALAIDLDGDLYQALAYPLLAIMALLVVAVLIIRRFQNHIQETHTQRWIQRRHKPPE